MARAAHTRAAARSAFEPTAARPEPWEHLGGLPADVRRSSSGSQRADPTTLPSACAHVHLGAYADMNPRAPAVRAVLQARAHVGAGAGGGACLPIRHELLAPGLRGHRQARAHCRPRHRALVEGRHREALLRTCAREGCGGQEPCAHAVDDAQTHRHTDNDARNAARPNADSKVRQKTLCHTGGELGGNKARATATALLQQAPMRGPEVSEERAARGVGASRLAGGSTIEHRRRDQKCRLSAKGVCTTMAKRPTKTPEKFGFVTSSRPPATSWRHLLRTVTAPWTIPSRPA